MKAVIYTRYGPPGVLKLADVQKPIPSNNEVLIKITATTVTAGDTRMRSFTVPLSYWIPARLFLGIRGPKQTILGMELAGVVDAVGKDVTRFQPGDLVFASTIEHDGGAYAEYICLPEDGLLATRSVSLSDAEAATLPIGGRTALYFLRAANIQPGQRVLIYGASGSVGTFAVQIAKYFGADVTGVCSTANLKLVKSLGADSVVDYSLEDFTRNDVTYDVIFDTVGKAPFLGAVHCLADNGVLLHAVAAPGVGIRMKWASLTTGRRMVGGGPPRDAADLITLRDLVEAGKLKPVIDRRYSLAQIVEAHQYVDTGRKRGNVVITVASHE